MSIQESLSTIFNEYADEKRVLITLFKSNRIYNMALKERQTESALSVARRSISLSSYPVTNLIINELPQLIVDLAKIPMTYYHVEGSVGKGNIAEIPWISVFDKEITESARKGYYVVLLFTSDSKGAFLSLNQGCTQYFDFAKKSGKKKNDALKMLSRNAKAAGRRLRSTLDFNLTPISLGATDELGLAYQAGNICSKYYSFGTPPSDIEFINDLRNLLGIYRELKGLVGVDIMHIEDKDSEEYFQEKVQSGHSKILQPGPIGKKNMRKIAGRLSFCRDPDMAFTALEAAEFRCENDLKHETFLSDKTGKNFVEAHHLVPIEFQDLYENSIDVPENIIALCPNCHRAFHNSSITHKQILIERFYSIRRPLLAGRGITLSLKQLIGHYKIDCESDIFTIKDSIIG